MARIRLVLLGLLAVFAVSAVASASASAAECKSEANKKFAFCVGTGKVLTEGEKFNFDVRQPTGATYTLTATGITIVCSELLPTLTLMSALKGVIKFGAFQLHFLKCKITVGEHCVLENELILTEKLNGKVIAKKEIEFYPETGTTFATIVIKSSGGECLIAGSDKVVAKEGKAEEGPVCGVPSAEEVTSSKTVECGAKASNLKFAGKEAKFEGKFNTIYLVAEKEEKFSFVEGV
jgi:hypothetical protein